MNTTAIEKEKLARLFHETYERLAPDFGYKTKKETQDFNPNSPNGKLMIAVCQRVLIAIRKEVAEEIIGEITLEPCPPSIIKEDSDYKHYVDGWGDAVWKLNELIKIARQKYLGGEVEKSEGGDK